MTVPRMPYLIPRGTLLDWRANLHLPAWGDDGIHDVG
jgi:hypothetical protein